MTKARTTPPSLYTLSEIKSKPHLSAGFIRLANQAFSRSGATDKAKWDHSSLRFPTADKFFALVTEDSMVAIIFDLDQDEHCNEIDGSEMNSVSDNTSHFEHKKIVACAAAVPWAGGWPREAASPEPGWEIKAVSVDGDEKFLRRGLAIQLVTKLESYFVQQTKMQLRSSGSAASEGQVSLWILTAECANGAYWRKRGFREVRRKTHGEGVWSCKTSFEMLVLRRDVEFEMGGDGSPGSSVVE